MRINGFEQIKGFYSWVFNNQEKNVKSQHMSLYMFLVNQNNRNSWVEWFKVPFDLAMAGSGISNKRTYYNCLSDLQNWELIQYQPGVNNWKAPLIKLEVLKDTSTVPQSEPQHVPEVIPQHVLQLQQAALPQLPPNIKLLTSNLKLLTDNHKLLLDVIDFAKQQNLTYGEKEGKSIYSECMDLYNNFIIDKTGVSAKIDGQQGKSLKSIISYLKKQTKEKTDQAVIEGMNAILTNYDSWDNFHKKQLTLSEINSNLINIINSIKNGKRLKQKDSKVEATFNAFKKAFHQNI